MIQFKFRHINGTDKFFRKTMVVTAFSFSTRNEFLMRLKSALVEIIFVIILLTTYLLASVTHATDARHYYSWSVNQYNDLYDSPYAACQGWVDRIRIETNSTRYSFSGFITRVPRYDIPYYGCELLVEGQHIQWPAYEPGTWRQGNICPPNTTEDAEGVCVPGDKNGGSPGGNQCEGNPINTGVGNKFQIENDYIDNQQFPLKVSRAYNSIVKKWDFLLQVIPAGEFAGPILVRNGGKKLPFTADGLGGWSSDPDVTGTLESFEDGAGNITGWRYTTLDNLVEDYDASGKLLSVTNRAGLTHTYVHTSTDIKVTHSNGDVLIYQLDSIGRISGFITPDNEQYTYTYDAWGNLASLTYPNGGGTRTYHYENTSFPGALTGITDANGNRFATWTYDAEGRAISSEHAGGAEKVTLDYTYLNDPSDPRTVATNALGKQTTYHFTTLFGVRKVTQVEGHPSPNCAAANKNYTYDANGFVASKTDWKGNTTTYVRNSKGQELSRTEASGTPQARTINTEWHPTFNLRTKVTEPDRETTYIYDSNGNVVNQQTTDLSAP